MPHAAREPVLRRDEGRAFDALETFARDVRQGLTQRPFSLPAQYLYDDLGSSLFESICRLPWYPITRAEKGMLARQAGEILRAAGQPLTVVELGCGTGEKLDLLLDAWPSAPTDLGVTLIDVSRMALDRSARLIAWRGPTPVVCHQATYEQGLALTAEIKSRHRLVLLLGSNLGNFEPAAARLFLAAIRATLRNGDHFLLGVDLVKPEPVLRLAYDDPLGVTAAFNLNLLVRMNRELHSDFDVRAFTHRVAWNAGHSRVEMHLVSRSRQTVRVPGAGCTLDFEEGDDIWTESSYKYTRSGIEAIVHEAGFGMARLWVDEEAQTALTLLSAG